MVPSGAFSPSDPAPWKGRVAPSASSAPVFWCSPQRSLPSWGPLTLGQILPEKKRASQSGLLETTQGSSRYVLFQDDRKHRQEFRAVLFPFFSRGLAPVPPQSTSGFPLPEKNPKTHGVLAGQDSVPQGGSQGRATRMKNSGIELDVIDLGIKTHVVPGK